MNNKSTFEEELNRSGVLCYTVTGVSMLPLLHQHQDIVVIKKPGGRLKKNDVALYKTPDGRYILHRVLKVREKDYVICGDNCIRKEYGITDEQIIGVLDHFVRNGKKHTLDGFRYRLYSRLICDLYYPRAAFLWNKMMLKRVLRKLLRLTARRERHA